MLKLLKSRFFLMRKIGESWSQDKEEGVCEGQLRGLGRRENNPLRGRKSGSMGGNLELGKCNF